MDCTIEAIQYNNISIVNIIQNEVYAKGMVKTLSISAILMCITTEEYQVSAWKFNFDDIYTSLL